MLKRINRLSKRKEFQEIREKGRILQSSIFGLVVLKKDDDEKRFGFIISKKISKRAVDRNKIKRYLAESVRQNLEEIPAGIRAIFLAKKSLLGKRQKEVEDEVVKIILGKI